MARKAHLPSGKAPTRVRTPRPREWDGCGRCGERPPAPWGSPREWRRPAHRVLQPTAARRGCLRAWGECSEPWPTRAYPARLTTQASGRCDRPEEIPRTDPPSSGRGARRGESGSRRSGRFSRRSRSASRWRRCRRIACPRSATGACRARDVPGSRAEWPPMHNCGTYRTLDDPGAECRDEHASLAGRSAVPLM
jgi:hypothetical protein